MFRPRFVFSQCPNFFGQTTQFTRKPTPSGSRRAGTPIGRCALSLLLLLLAGCATTAPQASPFFQSSALAQQIAAEPVGDFYIGRRVYAPPFAIWGYVRSPGQSWKTAKLVILNEKFQFAPDRVRKQIGSDNGSEYRLYGYFSGDQIYDAAAGRFCPEFVLKRAELISPNPDPIWSPFFIRDRQMFLGWPRGGTQPTYQ